MAGESFIEVLERYGELAGPGMRYVAGADFEGWKAEFLEAVKGLRGAVPARVPLAVTTESVEEEEDHHRHRLSIAVNEVWSLPAYLLVPKGISDGETRPGLVVLHGHDAFGMDSMAGLRAMDPGDAEKKRAYALHAVRDGYVAMIPAWWGWPGRDGHVDAVGRRDKCNVIQMAAGMYGLNVLDMHIEDGQAAIDALAARPEVDPDRIGCMGNSYGGRTTMWLALFDERIRAIVSTGALNTFRERSLKLSSCAIQYLPGILQYGDVHELYAALAPRPLHLQSGKGDGLITPADRDAILETVRAAYASAGAAEKVEHVDHPDGHLLRWDLAAPFLKRHLRVAPPTAG